MRDRINAALRRLPEWVVWALGAIPLALLVWDGFAGKLGVDPVVTIEHRLGRTAIYFLIASLAVTPMMRFARINAVPFRRALGLLAASYALLHVFAWALFDMGFLWRQMISDVVKRPYLLFGMGASLVLLALAATSSKAAIRRMGGVRWKQLHRAVYVAVCLAALHWLWVYKTWHAKPMIFAAVILVLLGVRLLPRRAHTAKKSLKNKTVTPV